jgi:hypothetical protein
MAKKTSKPERFVEILAVQLTPEEIAAYADMAARTAAEADRRESDRATRNKVERETIELLEGEVRGNLRRVRERREDREVECEEIRNFSVGSIQIVRLDTNEVVRERSMTMEERQEQLFPVRKDIGE